jgi:hypothetical protein
MACCTVAASSLMRTSMLLAKASACGVAPWPFSRSSHNASVIDWMSPDS